MRRYQQKQILDCLQTLDEAHREMERASGEITGMLGNCQEFAFQLIDFIEETEGEGTKTASLLDEYCVMVYNASAGIGNGNHTSGIKKQLVEIQNSVKTELAPDKIEIAFFPYKASMFDAFETIWREAKNDPGCDAYVIPIPYYDKLPDGSFGEAHLESGEYPDYVELTDWRQYDTAARRPDIIFIHNPYDGNNRATSVHPDYYGKRLRELTDLLVYVPYFVSNEDVGEDAVRTSGCIFAHKVIVQSEKIRQTYIRVYKELCEKNGIGELFGKAEDKFLAFGSPKLDKVINSKRDDFTLPESWERLIARPDGSRKKVVLYNTTIGTLLEGNEAVLDKLRYVFSVFRERSDVVLWWRPHPLSKSAYESMRPHLLEEYNGIVTEYKRAGFGIYDNTSGLHRAIAFADAYYGEGGSLVLMFELTGKPLMMTNNAILGEGKTFVNPYFHSSPAEHGGHLWASLVLYNALIKIDKINMEVERVVPVPNREQLRAMLFRKPVAADDRLILVPYAADYIAVYNINSNEFTCVDFELPAGYQKVKVNMAYKFLDGFIYKEDIFFVPCSFPAIARMNIKTGKLDYYSDWMETTEKYPEHVSNFRFISCIRSGFCLLMPCVNANAVVVFDMEKCQSEVCRIGRKDNGFSSICFDGQYYWLIQVKNNRTAVRWNREDNSFKEFDGFPDEFDGGEYAFAPPVSDGERIWLIPYNANMAFYIDVKGEKFVRQKQFETEYALGRVKTASFPYAAMVDNRIVTQSYKRNLIVKYDTASGTTEESKLKISAENREILDSLRDNCSLDSEYSRRNYRYLEALNLSLQNFLYNLTNEKLTVNDNQRKHYGGIISHADGGAGKAVYDYFKNLEKTDR